jgi:hypothetical protein
MAAPLATSPPSVLFHASVSPVTVSSLGDGFSANSRFIELQKELRFVLSAGVNSLAPSRAPSPSVDHGYDDEEGLHDSSGQAYNGRDVSGAAIGTRRDYRPANNGLGATSLPRSISHLKGIKYLINWINECAGFLDKFDEAQHFGVQVPILAQSSPALLHALLAFSARQTERKNAVTASFDSLELYQESIRLLSDSLQARDPNVLVTVCILACLELMSGSPKDWKRHLEGCASLFAFFGVNGFSGGLLQAVFWCYARMELCGVIISNYLEATVLPLAQWVPSMPIDLQLPSTSPPVFPVEQHEAFTHRLFREQSLQCPDMHANWSVYLCTRVCDLIRHRIRLLELGEEDEANYDPRPFAAQWLALWHELAFWLDRRPSELLPVNSTGPASQTDNGEVAPSQIFPPILFTHWAAISSNQLYHTACIILLDTVSLGRPQLSALAAPSSTAASSPHSLVPQAHSTSIIWHAKRVCGISMTNPHLGNLVNAIQPLFIAGKYLSHLEEHLAVGRLLKKIDRSTGWGALWRLRDLEAIWGYDHGEIMSAI